MTAFREGDWAYYMAAVLDRWRQRV
jgi:hypothetical protein